MKRFFWLTIIFGVFCLAMAPAQIYAGEGPPPGTIIKGKTISGTMAVILLDPSDTDAGTVFLVLGTCNKVPFQIGPVFRAGSIFSTITEEGFSQFFLDDPTGAIGCSMPDGYRGYAFTGFKNWVQTGNAISTDAFLTPVINDPKAP